MDPSTTHQDITATADCTESPQVAVDANQRPKPMRMGRLQFLVANLLIVFLVYSNLAVVINHSLPKIRIPYAYRLPISKVQFDLFLMFGVFGSWREKYSDVEVFGLTPPTERSPTGSMIRLARDEFFPFSPGETSSRARTLRHGYIDKQLLEVAQKSNCVKIRERHNRLHPSVKVEKIAVTTVTWPRSYEDYGTLSRKGDLKVLCYE